MFVTNTSQGLGRAWYPVAASDEVGEQPISVQLLGRRWALYRGPGGLVALADRCPHRLAPLSIGTNCGAFLQCRYHGWEFGPDGRCLRVPSAGAHDDRLGATVPPGPASTCRPR